MRVLLFSEIASTVSAVSVEFKRRGDTLDRVTSMGDALAAISVQDYDVVIADLEMRAQKGADAIAALREAGCASPILSLSAAGGARGRIESLRSGADDCLTKPCDLEELSTRARALARRRLGLVFDVVEFGALRFDRALRAASLNGEILRLTQKELSALELLVTFGGRPVHKQRIYENLYGFDRCEVEINAVETHVSRLRKKLEASDLKIETLRAFGYRLIRKAATGGADGDVTNAKLPRVRTDIHCRSGAQFTPLFDKGRPADLKAAS